MLGGQGGDFLRRVAFGAFDLQVCWDDFAWQVQHFALPGLTFSWQAHHFKQMEWTNRKTLWYEAVNFPFLKEVLHNCCIFPESFWAQGSSNSGGLYLNFSLMLHIFSSSHLLILTSSQPSHLLIFTSSHLHIFSSSHLLIFTSHIFSSSHLLIFTFHIFTSSHLHIFSSSHPHTSSHPHIFTSWHPLIFTSSHLHSCSIFSS